MRPVKPPYLAKRLFEWFCQDELFEELQGDLEEAFLENCNLLGERKAARIYWREVLLMIRPSVVSSFQLPRVNHIHMIKNYFTTSMRNLMRNPINSFINLFGLSVAIAVCILVYGFATWTHSIDQYHENKAEIYLVTHSADRDGELRQFGSSPAVLGEHLKKDYSQVVSMTRVHRVSGVAKNGVNVFHERITLADPDFLKMFSFDLIQGNNRSLMEKKDIVLSQEMAKKYFGDLDPIGKEVILIFDEETQLTFHVSGVANKFLATAAFRFDFLININVLNQIASHMHLNDWSTELHATLIQVEESSDLSTMVGSFDQYKEARNQAHTDTKIESFELEQFATLNKKSHIIQSDVYYGSSRNYTAIGFLLVIGGIMLVIASLNYINIAIYSATKRLKEIGVRKTIGASRGMLTFQFLAENIFMTGFALAVGLILGVMVFIPWFENISDFDMGFDLMHSNVLILLPSLMIGIGIISGLYPALHVSKFEVSGIIGKKIKYGRDGWLSRIFLGVQLVLSCLLIASAVMFTQNSDYLAKRSWGYQPDGVLYARVSSHAEYQKLRDNLSSDPGITRISGVTGHLGKVQSRQIIKTPESDYEANMILVDDQYLQILGVELTIGRLFDPGSDKDRNGIVINETFANSLGFENPIGEVVKLEGERHQVIGVVKDFHYYSFYERVKPSFFKLVSEEDTRFLVYHTHTDDIEALAYLQAAWGKSFPDLPFDGGLQSDIWGSYFTEIESHGRFWRGIALMAVLLAGLGLYGVVSLNVSGRTREFSIKKVLGADMKLIGQNIASGYLGLFGISLMLAAPISYLAVFQIMEIAYRYHMPMNITGTILGVLILMSMLGVVIAVQVKRVSNDNPVVGLRSE